MWRGFHKCVEVDDLGGGCVLDEVYVVDEKCVLSEFGDVWGDDVHHNVGML